MEVLRTEPDHKKLPPPKEDYQRKQKMRYLLTYISPPFLYSLPYLVYFRFYSAFI